MPNGETVFLDKRHLYRGTGGEVKFFTRGTERKIVTFKGVKFCLQICYDLRFPVWSRNTTGYDYDILIYCAAWPEVKITAWDIMLASRGIENQCYVVGVNCVGDDGMGVHYNQDCRFQPRKSGSFQGSASRLERLRRFCLEIIS